MSYSGNEVSPPPGLPRNRMDESWTSTAVRVEPDEPQGDRRGWAKYTAALKNFIPFRRKPKVSVSAVDDVGLWGTMFASFITNLVWKAHKNKMTFADLGNRSPYDTGEHNANRMLRLWETEVARKGAKRASMMAAVWRFVSTRVYLATAFFAVTLTCYFVQGTIIIEALLSYTSATNPSLWYGLVLVAWLIVTELVRSFTSGITVAFGMRTGTRLQVAMTSMGYDKVLRLRSLKDKSVGQLVNMFVNDCFRLAMACQQLQVVLLAPLIMFPVMGYATYIMGPWALLGCFMIMLFLPLQLLIGAHIGKLRRKCVKITDSRVRMTSELLNSVKLIKMYAWEKPFTRRIQDLRKKETKLLQWAGFWQAMVVGIGPALMTISSIATFTAHVMAGNDLTPEQAFTVLACFTILRSMLMITPFAVRSVSEAIIATRRMKDLMIMEERKALTGAPSKANISVEIRGATLAWDRQEKTEEATSKENHDADDVEKTVAQTQEGDTLLAVEKLFDINLTMFKGTLLGVCGSVGAGKSSVISAILNEMRLVKGDVAVEGKIAYVAQQAWILNATVKDNILFGEDFNSIKYDQVIEACCLKPDFEQLPGGDLTEIGERGVNLSGGQKQRISLARALYADKDIYLLDDPLSAVDAHVGEHIFRQYIKEGLRGKTVFFVTHQLQYLSDCDEVLLLKDGRIAGKGPHRRLMTMNAEYAEMIQNYLDDEGSTDSSDDEDLHVTSPPSPIDPALFLRRTLLNRADRARLSVRSLGGARRSRGTAAPAAGAGGGRKFSIHATPRLVRRRFHKKEREEPARQLSRTYSIRSNHPAQHTIGELEPPPEQPDFDTERQKEEERALEKGQLTGEEDLEVGSVKYANYTNYIKFCGGYLITFLVLVQFLLNTGISVFANFWISFWLEQGDGSPANGTNSSGSIADNPNLNFYVIVLGGTALAMVVSIIIKFWSFSKVTIVAAYRFHKRLFQSVFRSPTQFFDTTPNGRILNRFSKDMDEVDAQLPFQLNILSEQLWSVLASIISIAVVFPWLLVAIVPISVLFYVAYYFFRSVVRDLKRFQNVTRTPWLCHMTETLQGLTTIHAYNKDEAFRKKLNRLLDQHTHAFFMWMMSGRWVLQRVDLLVISVNMTTALLVVLFQGTIPASQAGLALTYALQIAGLVQHLVRITAETESTFTSVERLRHYIKGLEWEAPETIKDADPSGTWPEEGSIQLLNLSMRYRENLPLVLKSVTCYIRSCEKIGIVGRTGSGKSSLGIAIFRLVEAAEGSIYIDGVDISKIGLHSLRSQLSIIPQDPVLFVGTVRYNLDPFDAHSDEEVWGALERVHMADRIGYLDDKLESAVVENGENFSVGERQLMCMARALLRNSKILILDEATAAIDSETDTLIQTTIHEAFEDCTMLTIAHRLNTVMTSHRVMVMDDGQLSEFDTPRALLANKSSRFAAMVKAAGIDVTKYITMETDDVTKAEENSQQISETGVECTKL
ncbi:ATP-binding cassette sub-family C member 5-like [Branchiostoma floridae x Branchiostoma japonicum]